MRRKKTTDAAKHYQMPSSFQTTNSFAKREAEAKRILEKYPDRVPVIVEKSRTEKELPTIDRVKFLVPGDLTFGQFQFVIRKRLTLESDKALYAFVGDGTLIPVGQTMNQVYAASKDKDQFLYVSYASESTFGGE